MTAISLLLTIRAQRRQGSGCGSSPLMKTAIPAAYRVNVGNL
ncbi:hypothetical protein [Acidithiobacillus ferriphilus]|nr:hypothetical protein [Acidithiobacillus ferriphilus]